jgi:tRNA(fMet)-specific endonuclease VapC
MAVNDILLDTNAYAAFKQGQPDAVEIVQRAIRLTVSSSVLGELLAGFAVGSREIRP